MNFTLFFEDLEKVHLYKDVGMIPIYLKKLYNINCSIVFYSNDKNKELNETFEGIKLIKLNKSFLNKIFLLNKVINPFTIYLIKNAKQIDFLMMFHIKRKNFFYRFLYKLLNPDGKTYLKLDINILQINDMEKKSKHVLRQLEVNLSKFNIVSIETKKTYQKFKKLFKLKNLLLLPNGFDNLDKNIPNVIPFEQKENIIITVGRIGTRQKNNQLLLTALEKIDLKDWKVYFIGPIENEFMPFIEKFFNNNTYLKNKVFFTGSIKNRKKLYNWYNKSKVFCLTSRWEAFSLVLCEALYFGNYIITTNTGAAEDITDNGKIGKIIDMHDANLLASELQSIIDKKNRIDKYYKYIINHCRKYFLWENIIKNFYDNVLK